MYEWYYQKQRKLHNFFLSEEAAETHLKNNKHHYSDKAYTYVDYLEKNPEMEIIKEFLKSIKD